MGDTLNEETDSLKMKYLKKTSSDFVKKIKKRIKKKKAKENKSKSRKLIISRAPIKSEIKNVEITYIKPEPLDLVDPKYLQFFENVLNRFTPPTIEDFKNEYKEESKLKIRDSDDLSDEEEEEEIGQTSSSLSKKQLKQMNRPSIAQLKQACKRPEVVESWDITSSEPYFLVSLKSMRNTVVVPIHWSQKRKYMQGKRGYEKPPFKLPHFIEATKISEIRQALQEKEAHKSLKQKQREKTRPKSHRMDIDYQVLHDAFFKYATKPSLTSFGDLYFEGKENEVKMRQFVPGKYSERLKNALGMTENAPPSWLINMQRFGPPPSYPNLKIPGLNCPIPKGCVYGFHAGGWGKPPVDEFDQPLYGDFRTDINEQEIQYDEEFWGNIMDDIEEEAEDSDDIDQTEEVNSVNIDGIRTPSSIIPGTETPFLGGITSVSGLTSVTSGLETPDSVDIRRRGFGSTGVKPYTILQQKEISLQPGALFSSNIGYKIPSSNLMGGYSTPLNGTVTPTGISTPMIGGMVTPSSNYANIASGGISTPLGNSNGVATPNILAPENAGISTPSGVPISIGLSEDQDGTFTAENIRSQLKHFEQQSSKAIKAAGLIDPQELQKKQETGQTKKKKKKEFKF